MVKSLINPRLDTRGKQLKPSEYEAFKAKQTLQEIQNQELGAKKSSINERHNNLDWVIYFDFKDYMRFK